METTQPKNNLFTVKNIIRAMALLAEICFFTPLCIVSCSGKSISLTGLKSAFGFSVLGEHVKGNAACVLLLILPLLIIGIFFVKALWEKGIDYLGAGIAAVINFLILIVYQVRVSSLANDQMVEVRFTGSYYLDVILSLFMAGIGFYGFYMAISGKGTLTLPGPIAQVTASQAVNNLVAPRPQKPVRHCTSCQAILNENAVFCGKCGAKNEILPEQTQATPASFCPGCGKKLEADAAFCPECGTKI